MNYITFGKKQNPAIVFMHGWGGNLNSWGIIPARLAGFGFYSIVVDFSGFGGSVEPKKPYGVAEYADEILQLLNELEIRECSFIGHSFGGRVAIKIAGERNFALQKLVLVDSAGVRPRRGIKYRINVARYKRAKKKVQRGLIESSELEKYGSSDYKALSGIMKKSFIKYINRQRLTLCH